MRMKEMIKDYKKNMKTVITQLYPETSSGCSDLFDRLKVL
jgi:hypothetical protein